MNEKDVETWGIHGGRTGDADSLFSEEELYRHSALS
jgi:hypothetical protein